MKCEVCGKEGAVKIEISIHPKEPDNPDKSAYRFLCKECAWKMEEVIVSDASRR